MLTLTTPQLETRFLGKVLGISVGRGFGALKVNIRTHVDTQSLRTRNLSILFQMPGNATCGETTFVPARSACCIQRIYREVDHVVGVTSLPPLSITERSRERLQGTCCRLDCRFGNRSFFMGNGGSSPDL